MELRHALLGLLAVRPMSGYDLNKAFAGSAAHFWYADQSQIYRVLDKLGAGGLIATEDVPQRGKPDRKVHSLTERGRAELSAWLASPLEEERVKSAFLARLFFSEALGREGVLALLDEREQQLRQQLARLDEIEVEAASLAGVVRAATLEYGLAGARAELEWIERTRRAVEAAS